MKKTAVALVLCMSIMAFGACGKTNADSNIESTEAATEEATEQSGTTSSADIEYNVNEYVTLGDYKNMEVTLDNDYAVTDEILTNYINNNVISTCPYYVESDKQTVENGDVANIDYEGLLDGEAFDGGTAQDYDLEIGSGSFIDGFEDGLIGANVGEEKELNLTFPENYTSTDLAGKAVVFKVKVNSIKQKQDMSYDTLTDDYVAYLSDKVGASYQTVDELIADIRAYLEQTASSSKSKAIRSAALEKLGEICTVDKFPEGLLEARVQEYIDTYTEQYCKETTLEDYISKQYGITVDEFKSQITSEMQEEVKTQMILEAIAEAEDIKLDEDGFKNYVSGLVSNYGYDTEDTLYKNYGTTAEAGKKYLQKIYVCNQALDSIIDSVKVSYDTTDSTEATESITESTEEATEN